MTHNRDPHQSITVDADFDLLDNILRVGEQFGRAFIDKAPEESARRRMAVGSIGSLSVWRYLSPISYTPAVDVKLFRPSGPRLSFKFASIDGECLLQERAGVYVMQSLLRRSLIRHLDVTMTAGDFTVVAAGRVVPGSTLQDELLDYLRFASLLSTTYFAASMMPEQKLGLM